MPQIRLFQPRSKRRPVILPEKRHPHQVQHISLGITYHTYWRFDIPCTEDDLLFLVKHILPIPIGLDVAHGACTS
jgi:hypothetical protein